MTTRHTGSRAGITTIVLLSGAAASFIIGLASCATDSSAGGANDPAKVAAASTPAETDQRLLDAKKQLELIDQAQQATQAREQERAKKRIADQLKPIPDDRRAQIKITKSNPPAAQPTTGDASANSAIAAEESGSASASQSTPAPAAAAPEPTIAERRQRAVGELARALREESATGASPLAAGVKLAALDLIEPGASGGRAAGELSPRESELLGAWSAFTAETGSKLAAGDASAFADGVREAAARLDSGGGFEISSTALCSRVETFGDYDEFRRLDGTYKFLAGKRQRAVVYVELDRFGAKRTSKNGVEGWQVELTQDLALYAAGTDGGDMLAWRKPDQNITDFSRNKRRDFFVVQMIELPETLSVGSYRLKVTLRDRAGGATAEAVIPIDIVANASALSAVR